MTGHEKIKSIESHPSNGSERDNAAVRVGAVIIGIRPL
jgi:hypothetical protein